MNQDIQTAEKCPRCSNGKMHFYPDGSFYCQVCYHRSHAPSVPKSITELADLRRQRDAAQAEIAVLREALRPFAIEAGEWAASHDDATLVGCDLYQSGCNECGADPGYAPAKFTLGDLRRARAALAGKAK